MFPIAIIPGKALLLIIFIGTSLVTYTQSPNIIYIMTDDMGYGDLSCYGQTKYTTPHLDKLASQGMKFTNAYSGASLCTPTRTSFMTGRYPGRTPVGLIEPLTGSARDKEYGLTPDFPSLPALMKKSGYHTAIIGKWHLGFLPKHSPINNGFDYFFGIHSGAADYISHKGGPAAHDLYENDSMIYPKGYLTDLLTEKTISFIKEKHSKPFFLTLTFNAPHWPWQSATSEAYADSANFRSGGSPEIYKGMMKSLDDGIGKIMAALDEAQLSKNTIVIFTNDNGGEQYSSHAGLRDAKGSLWEGGIKVPAFVRWPEKIKPGSETDQLTVTMDWTATILALGKANADKNFPLDGMNLVPILTGKQKSIERTLYWRNAQRRPQQAVRQGDWKYVQDDKGEYLFNLAMDKEEKNDLKSTEPARFEKLKRLYAEWNGGLLKPIPL